MLPYFERWIKKLPNILFVAEADENLLLKLWEGLGYYSRVRNIQKTAKIIVSEYGGKFPFDYSLILLLPGIGRYTASAICSIAFNQDRALVDGNVKRVFSRFFAYKKDLKLSESNQWMWVCLNYFCQKKRHVILTKHLWNLVLCSAK